MKQRGSTLSISLPTSQLRRMEIFLSGKAMAVQATHAFCDLIRRASI